MGDSRSASRFMIVGTIVNALLNPFLIFGWLGLPALGIRGSALATVIAQMIATTWLFYLLFKKHRLILAFQVLRYFYESIVKFPLIIVALRALNDIF